MNDDAWSTPSEAECAVLRGRQAVVDVSHQPTALQVTPETSFRHVEAGRLEPCCQHSALCEPALRHRPLLEALLI